MVNFKDEILNSHSDLYVISLGTNDIRYRDNLICAMTYVDFINNIEKIIKLIKVNNPYAKIVLIAPSTTLDDDNISKLNATKKNEMIKLYSEALKKFSSENNYLFLNPNLYLNNLLTNNNRHLYMKDSVHPNETLGIVLYSKAVLESIN